MRARPSIMMARMGSVRGEFVRAVRAQTALALSLAIPMIVGALCIGTDTWALYSCSLELRRATYTAVMSGVRYLPANPVLAERTTIEVAELNGILAGEIVYSRPDADGESITMVVARHVPYRFARLFGLSQNVTVKAVAHVTDAHTSAGALRIQSPDLKGFHTTSGLRFCSYERNWALLRHHFGESLKQSINSRSFDGLRDNLTYLSLSCKLLSDVRKPGRYLSFMPPAWVISEMEKIDDQFGDNTSHLAFETTSSSLVTYLRWYGAICHVG